MNIWLLLAAVVCILFASLMARWALRKPERGGELDLTGRKPKRERDDE